MTTEAKAFSAEDIALMRSGHSPPIQMVKVVRCGSPCMVAVRGVTEIDRWLATLAQRDRLARDLIASVGDASSAIDGYNQFIASMTDAADALEAVIGKAGG